MIESHYEDELVATLLAPLGRVDPVTLAGRRRTRRLRLLACAVVVVGIVISGAAVADTLDPLRGIGAADHPGRASDTLDAGLKTQELRTDSPPAGAIDQIGSRLTESARFVGTLSGGRKVFVVPSEKGAICVVVAGSESCGKSLTRAEPVTFAASWVGPGAPADVYGVAIDGVHAVTFSSSDGTVTVPVEHNFYAYRTKALDRPPAVGGLTITFDDGKTLAIR